MGQSWAVDKDQRLARSLGWRPRRQSQVAKRPQASASGLTRLTQRLLALRPCSMQTVPKHGPGFAKSNPTMIREGGYAAWDSGQGREGGWKRSNGQATHLYPALAACQTPCFCSPLDLLSTATKARPVSKTRTPPHGYSGTATPCIGTFLCLPPLKAMRGSWTKPGARAKRIALGSGSPYMCECGWTP